MTFLRRLFSDIIGLVFFISSILKLMDPVGTGLIVDSYLSNWGIEFLRPASLVLGEVVSIVEAVVGIGLLTSTYRVLMAWLATAMTLFFTAVSIWLVAVNPDMSCGCFGEAMPLTHSQTLWKNIGLCICLIPAFMPYRNLGAPKAHRVVAFYLGIAIMLAFALYSLFALPLVDYTEFAPASTIVCEDSSSEQDGPVLPVWNEAGSDCHDMLLYGDVAVISYYKDKALSLEERTETASFIEDAYAAGMTPIVLSTRHIDIPGTESYYSDYRKLMTLNRSNGGVTFLRDGYIVSKSPSSGRPSFERMEQAVNTEAAETYVRAAGRKSLYFQGMVFVFLAVLILV